MTGYEMFWPMVAHVLLVFLLYGLLAMRRAAIVKAGKADRSVFRENRDEPSESLVVRNSIANQFELPVLFYAVSIVLYVAQADNLLAMVLAWIFVASRYAHAYVHVTINRLSLRGPLFLLGFLTLAAMWAWLAVWFVLS
ncbi:MAPEG family protein [Rhizobium sp. RAF56]|uniref:MAPEG family protein n=1 Tax=Rhizobium sp. RAF56 TaxID=3233062 RepID=UPI003F988489